MSSGRAIAPIFWATCSFSSSAELPASASTPSFSGDERRDRLPLDLVRLADHRRLGDLRVVDQRALDLHRADAVAGDVEHVVDAAEQPEVAVGVALGAVAGEVGAVVPPAPVRLDVALGVAVDAAQHRRPRPRQREQAAAGLDLLAARVADLGGDAGERPRRGPGLGASSRPGSGVIMIAPVSVCHHVSTTGQRSPPMCW